MFSSYCQRIDSRIVMHFLPSGSDHCFICFSFKCWCSLRWTGGGGWGQMHHIRCQQHHTQTRVETSITHTSTQTQQTGSITVPDSEGMPLHTCDKRPGVDWWVL